MSVIRRSSLLVIGGFVAGAACSLVGLTFAANAPAPIKLSNRSYMVSIGELRQNFVTGEEFSGSYSRILTMSDGSTREITLRPEVQDGKEVVELTDQNSNGQIAHSYLGPNGTTIAGMLMINVIEAAAPKTGPEARKTGR
ncbi:MAG TPA: hypothetical protein VK660_00175 [Xanthomonadaceae bacterium]|nr:hypothetical protein [Xanthomonadaceae bacterium]